MKTPTTFKNFNLLEYLKDKFKEQKYHIGEGGHGTEFQLDHSVVTEDCEDTKQRFWINTNLQQATCYKCGSGFRNLGAIIQHIEGLRMKEAWEFIRAAIHGPTDLQAIKKRLEEMDLGEPEELVEPPKLELPLEMNRCADTPPEEWPPYILQRINKVKAVLRHDIGWCEYGYYAGRMIIPVRNEGTLYTFIARALKANSKDPNWKPYLYPRKSATSQALFNYDRACKEEEIALTEGALDAIYVGPHAVAMMGKKLSRTQIALLIKSKAKLITIILDGDPAGREAADKIADVLRAFFRVRVVRLPEGKDPDNLPRPALYRRIDRAPIEGGAPAFAARVKGRLIGIT